MGRKSSGLKPLTFDLFIQHIRKTSQRGWFTAEVINFFAVRRPIKTYKFVSEPHYRNFDTSQLTHFAL